MEISPEPAPAGDLTPPEKANVRRRLIQSTLFPNKSPDNAAKDVEDFDEDDDEDREDEDDEYCGGSQGKRNNRKRKTKTATQSRVSKKLAANGKETWSKKVVAEGSLVAVKADFFLKASERRHQKSQQKELIPVLLPDDNEEACSPPGCTEKMKSSQKPKRRASATPKKQRVGTPKKQRASATPEKQQKNITPVKDVMNKTTYESCCGQMSDDCPIHCEKMSQPLPDLRLEAKRIAEENSRIFAGKQIHPFFSSWKTGKKNLERSDLESKLSSIAGNINSIDFIPAHVFEETQGDSFFVDWRNWSFSDRMSAGTTLDMEVAWTPIYKGSVSSLQFDNFLDISSTGTTLCQKNGSSFQYPIQLEEGSSAYCLMQQDMCPAMPSMFMDAEQVPCCDHLANINVACEMDKVDGSSRNGNFVLKSDDEFQGMTVLERMTSTYRDCGSQPMNSLWTAKYQPENASEICGNSESVRFLNEWLRLWQEKGSTTSKQSMDIDKQIMQGVDLNYCPSDCDSEDIEEETGLRNVLLVTGPVGSGKSAAIYACAREQGFQVIEINASDWRNGALVKQKFGEAVESHWLQCSIQNPQNSERGNLLKSFPASFNPKAIQEVDGEVIELIPLSDGEDPSEASGTHEASFRKVSCDKSETKTLILFEDVDTTFYEDRGFIATIQQLAETAKRPMILTSNSDNPVLPNNLDRLEVSFEKPSRNELCSLVYMVCAAEKTKIEPCLVERVIDHCQGDIRKTINELQFWFQGHNLMKDSVLRKTYGLLVFDIDAAHRVLPRITPSGYPSQLSAMIEKEISNSCLMAEKVASFMDVVDEEEQNDSDLRMHLNEPESVDAKKDAMLSRHCPDQEGNAFLVPCSTTPDLPSPSGSPVAFTRRNVRRKHYAIMPSDSEDECSSDKLHDKLVDDMNNEVPIEENSVLPSYSLANEGRFTLVTEQFPSEGQKEADTFLPSVTPDYSIINGTCKSVDMSFIPESSFVPETQLEGETSCGHVDDRVGEVSTSNSSMSKSMLVEYKDEDDIDNYLNGEHKVHLRLIKTFDLNTPPVNGEEVGDSHLEPREALPREYEMMVDECSRIEFCRRIESLEKPVSLKSTDFVQETWRKLRQGHMDLRQYASQENKNTSEVLQIAYGMTDLISEIDLLLDGCQSLTCDFLEPSMVYSPEKSHSFSWNDEQLQMASTIAEHGMCLRAKQSVAAESSTASVDLAWEMLTLSSNSMALGKLISRSKRMNLRSEKGQPHSGISSESKLESSFSSTVQSIVPLKSRLSLRGYVFHEYVSSLAQIARSESSRLSQSNGTLTRRRRVARNYLTTGALSLSPEEISLLDEYSCRWKVSSRLKDDS